MAWPPSGATGGDALAGCRARSRDSILISPFELIEPGRLFPPSRSLIADRDSALRFHAVQGYLEARRQHYERLGHLGAYVLDLLPRQRPIALVNQYFAIKRAGTL